MKSLGSIGLGLSAVFGCLFLALVVEIYYLLWWKRRLRGRLIEDDADNNANSARAIFYIFCCKSKKRPFSQDLSMTAENGIQHQTNKDLYLFDDNFLEAGFNLGPPRFLFTIKEETNEDLESEDGKSRVGRKKLSDLLRSGDNTPYVTPLSSPVFFTPPMTPSVGNAYNPFSESSTDAEFSKMKRSPPPKFKFLRDAEEKLRKNVMQDFG